MGGVLCDGRVCCVMEGVSVLCDGGCECVV